MLMKNGPELWAKILAVCPPGAFVAGGAVRDYFLGVEPKDIDVFVSTDVLQLNAHWETEVFRRIDGPDARTAEYLAMTDIDVVQRGTVAGWTVDLVYVGSLGTTKPFSANRVVESFDFGLTRMWFDGKKTHVLPEADADMINHQITRYVHNRPKRAQERFDRFNAAHGGDWRYVVVGE